jgi:hypothetical protein
VNSKQNSKIFSDMNQRAKWVRLMEKTRGKKSHAAVSFKISSAVEESPLTNDVTIGQAKLLWL